MRWVTEKLVVAPASSMLSVLMLVLLCATLIAVLYLTWRVIKMAQISFTVNIVISPAAQALAAVSDPLNLTGTVGQAFTAALASNVQGGTPPYTLVITGNLPVGLAADASGNITGTPTTSGTTTLSVGVTDAGA